MTMFKTSRDAGRLIISLQGGSSMPLCEVAEVIRSALSMSGLNVTVEQPPGGTDCWIHGWDGLLAEERVVVRCANGRTQPRTLPPVDSVREPLGDVPEGLWDEDE